MQVTASKQCASLQYAYQRCASQQVQAYLENLAARRKLRELALWRRVTFGHLVCTTPREESEGRRAEGREV